MKLFLTLLLTLTFSLLHAEWWNGTYDWKNAKKIHKGVVSAEWKAKSPRILRIFALRIDLHTPGLKFHVTPRADNYGEKMPDAPDFIIRTKRQTTRNFFKSLQKEKFNVVAAFNAAPWSPWRTPFTHTYADRLGFTVSDGDLILEPDGRRPSFAETADGKVDLITVPKNADISHIRNAVSGFSFVLKDGKVTGKGTALAPRTGYGISKNKRYFYVFIADGRQKEYSMGMNHQEVGEFLRYLGAHTGINMDGGGSSTLIVKRKNKAVMLNQQPGGGERTVGASLAVSVDK
jgi:hypothetical protein